MPSSNQHNTELAISKKILLVDNEPYSMIWLKYELTDSGFDVTLVGESKKAFEEVENNKYDLVFLDLQMGNSDIDGDIIYKKIRMLEPSLPVVFFTGYANDKRIVTLKEEGTVHIIERPSSAKEILCIIREILHIH